MLEEIIAKAPIFLLVAARCAALFFTLPLFSMRTTPRAAKVALAGYLAFFLMGQGDFSSYNIASVTISGDAAFSINYLLLILGEAMIGIIIGLFVSMIFAAFSTAGQFFAFQMGFSAASAYDNLSQVENPLMGQFFNMLAMLFFIENKWFQILIIKGIVDSVKHLNVFSIIANQQGTLNFLLGGLSTLFYDALIISIPIMGTLLFISVCTGLLSKAAPQMNLLSEGFPIMILVSFGIMAVVAGDLFQFFEKSFNAGIATLSQFIMQISR